jgi:diguanylate cyclase (GGDEF)-like protein
VPLPIIFSIIFFIAFSIYYFWGVFTLSLDLRSRLHRAFFFCCLALSVWAYAFSIANSAPDEGMSLLWRRVAAIGWGTFYSFMLYFILILTEKHEWLNKKWVLPLIFAPAVLNVLVFSLIDGIAVHQYALIRIYAGWVNTAQTSIWDFIYQINYVSFTLIGLGLLWQWGRSSTKRHVKTQSRLIMASFGFATILGTLTEFFVNLYLPIKIPQLAPVIVLLPILVMFYCVKKYGLITLEVKTYLEDETQILNEITRTKLSRYLGQAYFLSAFTDFATQYFNGRSPLGSVLWFFIFMLAFGTLLHFIHYLRIANVHKERIVGFIMAASIPLLAIRSIQEPGLYSISIHVVFVMIAVAFSHKWLLALVGSSALFSLGLMWFTKPVSVILLTPPDHFSRIVFFCIFVWVAFFINDTYLKRVAEKEKQVQFQKLLAQFTTLFGTINENNIDLKISDVLNLLGDFFKVDHSFIFFFSNDNSAKNRAYEWCGPGIDSIIKDDTEDAVAEFPLWRATKWEALKDGFRVSDVDKIREDIIEKSWLQENQIKSILAIPFVDQEKVMGFIGFDSIRSKKNWSIDDQEILRVISHRVAGIWLRVKAERRINFLAYHDSLTGLPNRALIEDRLDQAIQLAARTSKLVAAYHIDIDNLKSINDSMGHASGDILLQQVASRLQACLLKYDTVGRFGGDEFFVITPEIALPEDVQIVARKIMDIFRAPMIINNEEYFITASVGVAIYPNDGENHVDLIKHADLATSTSKEKGKNTYTLCTPELKNEFLVNIELSNSLYRALDRNELVLYYQPKVAAATGEISGVEALIRWFNPEKGLVSPGQFIPLAEKNGLINQIGLWVLETACRQIKTWQDQGLQPVVVAVNLSMGQFLNKKLVQNVDAILKRTGLDPFFLELEITESIFINNAEVVTKTLNDLKNLGIRISIDDFGTQFSSLSRLKDLPIDRIKIDRIFVDGIARNIKQEGIIKAIIQLARTLDLNVTAEGVETENQLAFLRDLACDEIQGFYFYRPMNAADVETCLKNDAILAITKPAKPALPIIDIDPARQV